MIFSFLRRFSFIYLLKCCFFFSLNLCFFVNVLPAHLKLNMKCKYNLFFKFFYFLLEGEENQMFCNQTYQSYFVQIALMAMYVEMCMFLHNYMSPIFLCMLATFKNCSFSVIWFLKECWEIYGKKNHSSFIETYIYI